MGLISAFLQVDYVTVTGKSKAQCQALEFIATNVFTRYALEGHKASGFRFFGYDGWKSSDFAFGKRYDGVIARAWGDRADDLWRELCMYCHNITRLDICVDCLFSPPWENAAELSYQLAREFNENRHCNLVQGSDGGQTFYLGARRNERFGRLYDKGIQSKSHVPGALWRCELELKGKEAWLVARQIIALDYLDQIDAMASIVYEFFDKGGILVPFPPLKGLVISRPKKDERTEDDVLEWLRKYVRPSVQSLCSLGRAEDVFIALGLDEV